MFTRKPLPISASLRWLCFLSIILSPLLAGSKTLPIPSIDSSYVSALAAADRLMQAWQADDVEHGMALLTSHAKRSATSDQVEKFFSNEGVSSYEITRGKLLRRGCYEFPVALIDTGSNHHARRHFSTIVVVNTGNNDWAVDKLP
jgi:hypothetical protein